MGTSAVHRSTRRARRLILAVPLAAALATGLSACADPAHRSAAPSAAATTSAPAASPAAPKPSPSASASPSKLNGTAGSRLTISDGSRYVVMDGTLVDFGTEVHDLAWSPDGKKAAFIDGSGSLVVSAPDGSARTTVAKNPGGQVWTHPTWRVFFSDMAGQSRNNLFFAAETNGVVRLMTVKPTETEGSPEVYGVTLASGDGGGEPALQTGNVWPSSAGAHGQTVYANRRSGEVFIVDDYLRYTGARIGKGSEPVMEPDGYDVVFVRSVDGHQHLFRQHTGKVDEARDLTPRATTDYSAPAFSRDGKTLAARTAQGVVTLPSDGSAAPTLVSEYPGLPAYRG